MSCCITEREIKLIYEKYAIEEVGWDNKKN